MINLQYLSDKAGHTTAVQIQIPIEEWLQFKSKYKEFAEEELQSGIPDWQISLGMEELNYISEGKAELMEWTEARKQFKL
jgi:hypothetical protein